MKKRILQSGSLYFLGRNWSWLREDFVSLKCWFAGYVESEQYLGEDDFGKSPKARQPAFLMAFLYEKGRSCCFALQTYSTPIPVRNPAYFMNFYYNATRFNDSFVLTLYHFVKKDE